MKDSNHDELASLGLMKARLHATGRWDSHSASSSESITRNDQRAARTEV